MNYKKIVNKDLITTIAETGTIEIIDMSVDNLTTLGFLDENGWPTEKFGKVIKDIDSISPTEFGNGVKFWDGIDGGLSIYNKFLEDVDAEIE